MSRFDVRRAAALKRLARCRPFVTASLCRVRRRCGNPRCRCSRDQPHQAYVLTYKVHAKTKTVHVPKDLLMEVRRWVQEYRQVKKLIREISYQSLAILRHHVPASRAVARSRKLSRS